MIIKRGDTDITKKAASETFEIKQKGSAVFIEGFANKAVVDRGNDLIDPKAWDLANFKKNPIILFNHGFDTLGGTPVGKATQIIPKDEGLYIKVKLSNSDTPAIRMVRDLVEEKILQAFSVGFEAKEMERATVNVGEEEKSINKITKAELFEVSIVGIPMNQESMFTISEKSLTTKSLYQIKKEVLETKGCEFAIGLHEKLHELEDQGESRKGLIELLAEASSTSVESVKDILAGNTEPSAEFVAACEITLKADALEEEEEDEKEDEDKEAKTSDGEKEEPEEEGEEDEDKEKSGSPEDEGSLSEKDTDGTVKDFQECVSSKIPALIEEGKDQDEAVAAAIAQCQESGKCLLSDESKSEVFQAAFAAVDTFAKTGEWDFASLAGTDILLTTEEIPETKQADQEGGEQDVTQPIETSKSEDDFGSPYLEGQKTTNVLLGTLVEAVRGLSSRLEGLAGLGDTEREAAEEPESKVSDDAAEEEEKLEHAKKALDSLSKRLKKLGY